MGGPILLLIVAIVVISAVVGAIAQFLNKLNEANAPPPRAERREAPRQTQKDMDRFLAEIDRLRKKNAENAEPTAAAPKAAPPPLKPVAKSKPQTSRSRPEKSKPRAVAEVVDSPRRRVDSSPMAAPPLPVAPGMLSPGGHVSPDALPVASVVGSGVASTGAPSATRVTKLGNLAALAALPGSKVRSQLGSNLSTLLGSGHGVAMAVILQEVLGPPKCKK